MIMMSPALLAKANTRRQRSYWLKPIRRAFLDGGQRGGETMKASAVLGVASWLWLAAMPCWAQDGAFDAGRLAQGRTDGKFEVVTARHGMHAVEQGSDANSFWAQNGKTAYDGTLTATFEPGKRPDFSVLFRATFPARLTEVSGYSVSMTKSSVVLHRWEAGYAAPMTHEVKLKKIPKRVEIAVKLDGPRIHVEIRDAATHKAVQSLDAFDASYSGTEIGYRQHRKQDKTSVLTSLAFEAATPQSTPPNWTHADAYLRQHPKEYVLAPTHDKDAVSLLKSCKLIDSKLIDGHTVYRCSPETVVQLIDQQTGLLPSPLRVAEPRYAFEDKAWRSAAMDMQCKVPMHCKPNMPIDPNRSTKDPDMISAYLNAYVPVCSRSIKHVKLETIGYSALGLPIQALTLTNVPDDKPRPRVMFNAAHHGIELLSTDFAFDVIESLCENPRKDARYTSWLDQMEVSIIPVVNPDGADMFFHASTHLGRKNGQDVFGSADGATPWPARVGHGNAKSSYYRYHPNRIAVGAGVDINRNYPLYFGAYGEKASSSRPTSYYYRGQKGGSESEIQAMMSFVAAQQFASAISFHTVSTKILVPYSIDDLKNPPRDHDLAWKIGERMSAVAGVQVNGQAYGVLKNLYSVDGTDQDWFRFYAGTYAYLVEGSMHNPTGDKQRDAIDRNRGTWETLLDATRSSYVIRVTVDGVPAVAEVDTSDAPRLNGEVWKTRGVDGTFATLCEPSKKSTLRVTLADGRSQTREIKCGTKPQTVEFAW